MRDFENNPYNYAEEFPTFRISVRTAARLIAGGLDEWNGEEIQDGDRAAFHRPHPIHESVEIGAHEFANAEPVGRMKMASEGIEAAIVGAVNQRHLSPRQVRRNLAGAINPAETYLNVDDVLNWCETVDLSPSETFFEYREHEENIAGSAYQYLEKERFKLENKAAIDDARESTGRLTEEEINHIVIENFRLREGHFGSAHQRHDRGIQKKERDTLLTIIAALAKAAKIDVIKEPGKSALYIEGLTAELGARASKRAIEEHLKKIPNALETRMK
jgi:hypothetical protein